RRIIGLPKHRLVYEGLAPSGVLRSKVEFIYDSGSIEGTEEPAQHDNIYYSASFVVGRGNLTSVLRYDVNSPENVLAAPRRRMNTTGLARLCLRKTLSVMR